MPKLIPPSKVIKGDKAVGGEWLGYADKQLRILERQMALARPKKLNEGYRTVSPEPGVVVECWSSFKRSGVVVTVLGEGKQGEEVVQQKKEQYKYIKIFVHVDVINKEDWDYEQTDVFIRSMVTSAISCGLVEMPAGKIVWRRSILHDYLADGTSTDWWGVRGHFATTADDLLDYYNQLFSGAPYYSSTLPSITMQWIEDSFSDYWSGITNDIKLKDTYYDDVAWEWTMVGGGMEEVTAPGETWCNGAFYKVYTNGFVNLDDVWNFDYFYAEYANADLYKNTTYTYTDGAFNCAVNTKFTYKYVHTYGSYPYQRDIEYNISHRIFRCPILGLLWDGAFDTSDFTESPSPITINAEYYDMREMRRTGSNLMTASYYPCAPTTGTSSLDWLIDMGQTLTSNYILDNGFGWYQGMVGGLINNFSFTTIGGTLDSSSDSSSFRTLVSFGAVGGWGVNPWEIREENPLHKVIRDLASDAILLAGGTVYPNSTLPTRTEGKAEEYIYNWDGITVTDMRLMEGVLYASPTLNIQVYAIPVKSDEGA